MEQENAARIRGVVGRLWRTFNSSAIGHGLTPSQADALRLVAVRGTIGIAELSVEEGLNPTMVSRIVSRLDELGLVERVQNPRDLRAAMVKITGRGLMTHEQIREERGAIIADRLARLSERDQETIVSALPALETLAEELRAAD